MSVITIAHRLDTIMHCDRVVVMGEGALTLSPTPYPNLTLSSTPTPTVAPTPTPKTTSPPTTSAPTYPVTGAVVESGAPLELREKQGGRLPSCGRATREPRLSEAAAAGAGPFGLVKRILA